MNQKQIARVEVAHAVRDGLLIRPHSCSSCGSGGRIMGHHHDYSKPLDVEWVCAACHGKRHSGRRHGDKFSGFTPAFRIAMLATGTSVRRLAEACNISDVQIRSIASGSSAPRVDRAVRIAVALNLQPEDLWSVAA